MKTPPTHARLRAAVLAAIVVACGSDQTVDAPGNRPGGAAAIFIVLPTSVIVGNAYQLTLGALDRTGNSITPPAAVWTSSNPMIAVITATGQVTAISSGTTTIRAQADTLVATAGMFVNPSPPVRLSLTVLPIGEFGDTIQLAPGQTLRLTSYVYQSEFPYTITSPTGPTTWTSSRPDLLSVTADGIVTAIAAGDAQVDAQATATIGPLLGTRTIRIAATPGTTTVRLLNAAPGLGQVTLQPSNGPPVALVFGESRELTVPAGTFQVTAVNTTRATGTFQADWVDTDQFLGVLPAQTHSTFAVFNNPDLTLFYGGPTFVPLWDWTGPVSADSVMVRVVLATAGGYNVYLVEPGGTMIAPFLRGCYLDWPYGVTDYSTRRAAPFDILLQSGKSLNGPQTARLSVTAQGGRAMTYLVVGDSISGFQVVSLVDR